MSPPVLGPAIMTMANQLARHSDDPQGLTCAYLTPAHRACAQQLLAWMNDAGLQAHIDAVGNVVGRLACGKADASTLMTGSHYDTVRNAGKYDGRLGVLLPIAVARHLCDTGVALDFDLEIIGFADEEGVRFGSTFLGSNPLAGRFDVSVLDNTDADGLRMGELLAQTGGNAAAIADLARDPADLLGFVEVHIEQGPVLLHASLPVGIVTSIAAVSRFIVSLTGYAGHAGTTPMNMRRDAAAGAAEMLLAIEARCSSAPGLVGTVGQLQVPKGSINVIPGACEFSMDIRAADDLTRDQAISDVIKQLQEIAARRSLGITIKRTLHSPCAPCAPRLISAIEAAVQRAGVSALRLPSGAGHDALALAHLTDVGMLFVRCGNGGVSHHPDEIMTEADATLAAQIFLDMLLHFPTSTHEQDCDD